MFIDAVKSIEEMTMYEKLLMLEKGVDKMANTSRHEEKKKNKKELVGGLTVRYTEAERKKLRRAVFDSGLNQQEFVRKWLRSL